MSAGASESRSERKGPDGCGNRSSEAACAHCGGSLGGLRKSATYCSARCKRAAWEERAHDGKVASVRRLKSGRLSIVVHMERDVGLLPGQIVRVG